MTLLLRNEFIPVGSVKTLEFFSLCLHILSVLSLHLFSLAEPVVFLPGVPVTEFSIFLILLIDLLMVSGFLLVELVQVNSLSVGSLFLLLLNLFHEFPNLFLETFLEFFLHLGVFLEFLSRGSDRDLQLLTSIFALTNEGLVLSHILLEVIKDLQLLIKSNQSVKFVFKFNFFLLKGELQFSIIALLKHRHCVPLSSCLPPHWRV